MGRIKLVQHEKLLDCGYDDGIPAVGTARAQKTVASGIDPVFEEPTALAQQNHIDELEFAHWKQMGVEPARLSSDAVFVRRAYLDVIGPADSSRGADASRRHGPTQAQPSDRRAVGAR